MGLHKTQMMRIRRTPTANQTGLFDDMPDMVAVTNPAWFDKDTLINLWRFLGQALIVEPGSNVVSFCVAFWWDHCELGGERFLHLLGSAADNWFFAPSSRPQRGFISRCCRVAHRMSHGSMLKIRRYQRRCAALGVPAGALFGSAGGNARREESQCCYTSVTPKRALGGIV